MTRLKKVFKRKRIWYTGIEPDWGNVYYHKRDSRCSRLVFRRKSVAYTGWDIDRRRFICRSYKEDDLGFKAGKLFRTLNKYYEGN